MSAIEVITEDLKTHPECPHGPTILFSKFVDGEKKNFFACSACRDRKHCSFFVYQNDVDKISDIKKEVWEQERKKFLKNINHRKLYEKFTQVQTVQRNKSIYCHTCNIFDFSAGKHMGHNFITNLTDYQLTHPSEILPPLDDAKKEAQFLFAQSSVEILVDILQKLNYKNVLCIGTPRIHEYIQSNWKNMDSLDSLLLDIDDRYHNFYSTLKFCWYNSFNHHFFFKEARSVYNEFMQRDNVVLITDPPFGGRIEPLAQTFTTIRKQWKKGDLSMFWIFPYFMEPQIKNSLPNFSMLDYKVEYDNHPLFQSGPKGRKYGSPVRIFTNVSPKLIVLPKDNYNYCEDCERWVSVENKHCKLCNSCTSKDGRTYLHCNICNKCVKPSWKHCTKCNRCAIPDHKCGEILFMKECFNCKKPGHKKRDCPSIDREELNNKRKKGLKFKRCNKIRKIE